MVKQLKYRNDMSTNQLDNLVNYRCKICAYKWINYQIRDEAFVIL